MREIVIDTNAYSFLCHGRTDVARLLAEYESVAVPTVVLGELEAGFLKGSRYELNKAGLMRFLSLDRVCLADVTARVAESYGRIYTGLKNEGCMIPLNDVWIAATAIARSAPLVTFDAHFRNIDGLDLILMKVEP